MSAPARECGRFHSRAPSDGSAVASKSMPLRITEIFHSIQGESTYAGTPCVFVRLTGCPLRCHYCDTAYAFRDGMSRTVADVLAEVVGFGCHLVEVTGGEPLAQREVHHLVTALLDVGHTVLIETSGAIDTTPVDPRARLILDVKTPGSGESSRNVWGNLARLRAHDEVKFVIVSREDYDFAKAMITEHALAARCQCVHLSPVHEQPGCNDVRGSLGLPPRQLAEWILEDRLPVRLQLQVHKFIWDPQTRGV